MITGNWMEEQEKRENFENFAQELVSTAGGDIAQIPNAGSMLTKLKCTWYSISFDNNSVTIEGALFDNSQAIIQALIAPHLEFKDKIMLDNQTGTVLTAMQKFMNISITAEIKGTTLYRYGTALGEELPEVMIEMAVNEDNPNELIEKCIYNPKQIEAKCYFTKVEVKPNDYAWCS